MNVPGVVARLMGLDVMPCPGLPKSYRTSSNQKLSFHDTHNLNRSTNCSTNDHSKDVSRRGDGYIHTPLDSRDKKLSRRMIKRYELETLQRSSTKKISMSHHRMLSPIKNSKFTSVRNLARIKEACPKIVNHKPQMSLGGNLFNLPHQESHSRIPSHNRELQLRRGCYLDNHSCLGLWPRKKIRDFVQRSTWNRTATSIDSYHIKNPCCAKSNKRKCVSMAPHAKFSVQKKECFSASRRSSGVYKQNDESSAKKPFITQSEHNETKRQKKLSPYGSLSLDLRQNYHKQHSFMSRDELAPSETFSTQQGRQVIGGYSSSRRTKIGSNVDKVHGRKDIMEIIIGDWKGSMSYNYDFQQKNCFTKRNSMNEKVTSMSEKTKNKLKLIQHNVVIDEHIRWNNGTKDSVDFVSFTFTSKLVTPSPGAFTFIQKSGTREIVYSDEKPEGLSLSLLLENKLKELTLKNDPFINLTGGEHFVPPASTLDKEPLSVWGMESGVFDFTPSRVKPSQCVDYSESAQSSTKGQILGCHKSEVEEPEEYICISNASQRGVREDLISPLSVFQSPFPRERCWSSECSDGSDGGKEDPSSFEVKNIPRKSISTEVEYIGYILISVNHTNDELEPLFVNREGSALDPLLFNKLEEELNIYTEWKGLMNDRVYRRLLFDCVNECLVTRRLTYFQGGYAAWSKGMIAMSIGIETEVCDEIGVWKRMGDLVVHKLVEKDMSSEQGTWVDFRVEAFEVGEELEREILSSLLDEVISDVCVGQRQQRRLAI